MYSKFSLALKQGYYPLKVAKDTLQEKSSLLIRHVFFGFCLLVVMGNNLVLRVRAVFEGICAQ